MTTVLFAEKVTTSLMKPYSKILWAPCCDVTVAFLVAISPHFVASNRQSYLDRNIIFVGDLTFQLGTINSEGLAAIL